MWKTVVLISIVLTTVIGGMLFWQWKAYSKQNDSINVPAEKVEQEITVKSSGNELNITQKITGITAKKEYKIIKPESLFRFSCMNKNNDPCNSSKESSLTIIPDQNELIFEYTIPTAQKNKAYLLEKWTAIVPEVTITRSTIIIVDTVNRSGTWAAGAEMKGFKEMDLIDYYYFEAAGTAPSLYWQSKHLEKADGSTGFIQFYSGAKLNNKFYMKELDALNHYPFVTVILTDQHIEQTSRGILILKPNIKEESLKRKLIQYYYEKKFKSLPSDQQWVLDVLTSYSANLPAETTKGKEVLLELKSKLSEDELKHFIGLINKSPNLITIKELDNYISNLRGLSTSFFVYNSETPNSIVPLYFYDSRKVKINGHNVDGIKVLYEEGKSLFPFIKTMKALDYQAEVLEDKETILLVKGTNTYRFFLNRNIFIYNEDDYGLLERPLSTINGSIYISKQWIETLFKVSIDEEEKEIILSDEN
ncbi:stalk domain-containing protein [Bacillus sp. S/N-304-OC-R1]|uniref:stalk domain-containing protein n=1 Tax=Bacillus sp. S/N-304-OC-R1 TaxID=2758034 RepID=UPI001C8D3644|nr:stalk domain-containing protein [Bacillus sp. S/N-304-OC-R1]MBY0120819.1 hypothetical protein [Bacillus sp. S/N-304-OC-R1]